MDLTAKLSILFLLIGSALCQYSNYVGEPLTATNYQTADSGRSETVDQDGNVQGQYSYVDPNGKTITVKYTAGKDGFKIVDDHSVAQQAVQPQPQYEPVYRQSSYQQPAYQQPAYQSPAFQPYQQPALRKPSFQSYQQPHNLPQPQSYQQHVQNSLSAYQPFQTPAQPAPSAYQHFQTPAAQPAPSAYQHFQTPAAQPAFQPQKPLFTPAEHPYPAATPGQIDNYQKALQEEKEEAAKALVENNHRFSLPAGAPEGVPQTPYNIQYGSDNGFSFEYNL